MQKDAPHSNFGGQSRDNRCFQKCKNSISTSSPIKPIAHNQPPTAIRTDNTITTRFIKKMQMKKSKSWDMHLHWLRDRKITKEFNVIWERGDKNRADYFTKHFSAVYHRNIRFICAGHICLIRNVLVPL